MTKQNSRCFTAKSIKSAKKLNKPPLTRVITKVVPQLE
jgi:hypothetical protein